jgi:ribose transport system ATP-binding protein
MDLVIKSITGQEEVEKKEEKGVLPSAGTITRYAKPLLKVDNLHYGNKIRGISFSVYPGEILGVAGLTGSGRTELLETIFGINKPEKGDIYIKDKKIYRAVPRKVIKQGVMLIPDERQVKGLILIHTIMNNMMLHVFNKIKRGLFIRLQMGKGIAQNLVADLHIVTRGIDALVSNLSGGNQQKVVFSRTFARGSNILLLDDPTLGIDVEAKYEIGEMIKKYVSSDQNAAVLVSSELELIARLCDRVIVLKEGKITHELEKNEKNAITEAQLVAIV